MTEAASNLPLEERDKTRWIEIGLMTLAIVASYGNTLWGTAVAWESPMYNHGYLIPAFTAFLLYLRREPFGDDPTATERWWGVGIIAAATIVRVIAAITVQFSLDRLSLIAALMGVFIMVGGFRTLRWAGPPLAFLVFMFPLPGFMVDRILRPMQTMATIGSVFALQTLGVEVYRDGNRIELEHSPMNVVDQCSGLRMLTIFIALAVAIAMISNHRPIWERIVIIFSSVPIALLVNIIRITVTGLLYNLNLNEDIVNQVFHDFAGLIMMPLALGFLFLEMQILQRIMIDDENAGQNVGVGLGTPT